MLDWVLTIAGAILIVFALKMWVVNPYRIPSSSMEPTLHCAKARARAARRASATACSRTASSTTSANPKRGEIIVFNTPPLARIRCGEGGTFVKRLIGLPGETVSEDDGIVYIDGKELKEPYIAASPPRHNPPQSWTRPGGRVLLHGRQPGPVLRLARLGLGARGRT